MSADGEKKARITEIDLSSAGESVSTPAEQPDYSNETEEERARRLKMEEIAERKAAEVFVSRNTGKWECQACGYVYNEANGYAKFDVKPGTPFDEIEKFRCPQVSVQSASFSCIYSSC
jgi:rubredoxin